MAESATVSPVKAAIPVTLEAPHGSASVHLDAMRGLAAISVAISHWREAFFVNYSEQQHHNFFMAAAYLFSWFGHAWVIVFFVMSGYLVGGSVLRSKRAGRWSWRAYLLARLSRLYVVLLPALLLGGLIDWIGMYHTGSYALYSGHSGIRAFAYNAYDSLHPGVFAGNLLYLQTILVPAFGSNHPLWSLAHEFWYYLAFPILVLMLSKAERLWLRVGCSLLLVVWIGFVGRNIAVLGIPWLMGVLLQYLPPVPLRQTWARRAAIFGAWLLVLGCMSINTGRIALSDTRNFPEIRLTLGRSWNLPVGDLLLSIFVTLLMWVTLYCAKGNLPKAYVWLSQRTARSSYTFYLVHVPALIFLKAWLNLPRVAPDWHVFLARVGLFFGIVLYGQLVYELFEKNTDRVRNWIKPYVLGKQRVSQTPSAKATIT